MSKKTGAYRITLKDGEQVIVGNNYKPWWQHGLEYIYANHKNPEHGWRYSDIDGLVESVEYTPDYFVDDGGLKWATPDGYQDIVDEMKKKSSGYYVPYKKMVFEKSYSDKSKLIKELKRY